MIDLAPSLTQARRDRQAARQRRADRPANIISATLGAATLAALLLPWFMFAWQVDELTANARAVCRIIVTDGFGNDHVTGSGDDMQAAMRNARFPAAWVELTTEGDC